MKVLTINNGYPSKANPNFTTYVKTIDECIQESGSQVENLVLRYDGKITLIDKVVQYAKFWGRCLVSKLDADIIYINHLPFAWPILFNPNLKNRRVIIHWHGDDLVGKSKMLKLIHKVINIKINQFEHIVPSEYFKKKLLSKFPLTKTIYISPSGGVDTDVFYPHKDIINQDQIAIGFASGLTTGKGADSLYEIMKYHNKIEERIRHQITFKIINYGGESGKYISLFKDTGAQVELIEKMSKNEMPDFYNSISILLMPSIREGESLGLVVLEAMSCNKPVLTYDICAFPEFVISGISGERCQFSLNLKDRVESNLEQLIKILSNYQNYTAREIVLDRYSKQSVIQFYKELFSK